MKKSLLASALMLITITASAIPPKSAPLVCPVTGEKIASIKAAVGHSVYKGKTYYFCCGGCKPMFDKNPAQYVKPAGAAKSAKAAATKS